MRLRLSVQRNNLPATNVLWNVPDTNSAQAYTIARLLEDVNQVLPLEAEQWGLEDYVVEIGGFECLHFSPVFRALKDDDNVSIRPLLTAEVRSRTLCGRHQISEDGRHLIDGIPFGRPYLRQPNRPVVRIPPRKRRRLEDAEMGNEEPELAGLIPNGEAAPLLIGNGSTPSPQAKQGRSGKNGRAVRFTETEADDSDDNDEEDDDFAPAEESDSDEAMDSDSSSASDSSDGSGGSSSSSDSDSNSESDSDSSSSDSDAENESVSSGPDVISSKNVPPGGGSRETQHRNQRRTQTAALRRLKAAGTLDENATLDDLRTYNRTGKASPPYAPSKRMSAAAGKRKRLDEDTATEVASHEASELERRKLDLMANVEKDGPRSETPMAAAPKAKDLVVEAPVVEMIDTTPEKRQSTGGDEAAPQKKRLRPDTSAIGRMLARQTRNVEKKPARGKAPVEKTPEPEGASDPDFWKSRIKLSAFECWDEEYELSAPPFPFKQHWDPASKLMREKFNKKNKKHKKASPAAIDEASQEVEEETLILNYDDSPETAKQDSDPTAAIENQLMQDVEVAAQSDIPPLPEDVESLPALEPKDIRVGAVIVFRMWVINPETITPEFSDYKTAVVEKEGDSGNGAGSFKLRLAQRDVEKKGEEPVDAGGEKVMGVREGFQMDVEGDEVWEGSFMELIAPKLLKGVEA